MARKVASVVTARQTSIFATTSAMSRDLSWHNIGICAGRALVSCADAPGSSSRSLYNREEDDKLLSSRKGPMRFLFLSLALGIISEIASPYGPSVCLQIARIFAVLRFAWVTIRAIDIVSNMAKRQVLRQRSKLSVLALLQRMLKIVVVFAAGMLLLQGAGVNGTTMLADLGAGGIAFALAAQKSLENLLGGISIIMREAIRVRGVCSIAGQTGMIEDIGLAPRVLRTVDQKVVSVPNAQIYQRVFGYGDLCVREDTDYVYFLSVQ